jgi:hypothetical protein
MRSLLEREGHQTDGKLFAGFKVQVTNTSGSAATLSLIGALTSAH